jgi:cytochrome b561
MAGPSSNRYDAVAVILHWTMALGIVALLAIGLVMKHADISRLHMFQLYQLHKSIGVVILWLIVLRIVWRLTHRAPLLPDSMPPLEREAAHLGHRALYALMLVIPLLGWAVVSAATLNIPTVLFGVLPWPHIPFLEHLSDKAPVEKALELAHAWGAYLLIVLVLGHIAAALRHAAKGDVPLTRMSLFTREK